jgi:hypothetical protein
MKSGYELSTNTTRTNGPAVNATYFNGYFREDYVFVSHPTDPTYLDAHNGRFCITPEYPAGIYCYFATVNADNSSAYPYVIGPTYYGNVTGGKVTTVSETTTTYVLANDSFSLDNTSITLFPNPAQNFITVQTDFVENDMDVELINELGQIIKKSKILQGTTFCIIETDTVYNGVYFIKITLGKDSKSYKVIINK